MPALAGREDVAAFIGMRRIAQLDQLSRPGPGATAGRGEQKRKAVAADAENPRLARRSARSAGRAVCSSMSPPASPMLAWMALKRSRSSSASCASASGGPNAAMAVHQRRPFAQAGERIAGAVRRCFLAGGDVAEQAQAIGRHVLSVTMVARNSSQRQVPPASLGAEFQPESLAGLVAE